MADFGEDGRLFRPQNNAARERSRVKTLRSAFLELQRSLPAVPPNTKLSKLDILVLATAYIYRLTRTLEDEDIGQADGQHGGSTSRQTLRSSTRTSFGCGGAVLHATDTSTDSKTYASSALASTKRDLAAAAEASTAGVKRVKTPRISVLSDKHPLQDNGSNSENNLTVCQSKVVPKKAIKEGLSFYTGIRRPLYRGHVGILHPVKKWPMRSRLYDSILGSSVGSPTLLPPSASSWSIYSNFASCNSTTPKQTNT